MYDHGEEIPYCRRLNETQQLDRNRSQCENEGVKLSFLNLLEEGIKPSNVLDWSSSVEINDLYAAFFFNRSLIENHNDPFICNCTMLGTFGKYCEYQWTNEAKSFSDAIKTQFEIKEADEDHLWNTQRYGKILCYETLPCNTGDLCLDWREICDGVQRCSSGIDEENWDKLEFNECEDNEFRCTNGMCIAEEFWLDGDHDCMDWSDEVFREQGETCPFDADSFKCDEHLCPYTMYSCGDGQCVLWTSRMAFQRFAETSDNCLSGRNLNYMCEANPYRSAWTLESGLCSVDEGYDDPRYLPWNMIDSSRLTENEKCQYLFRCTLSDGFERDCPCNSHNCTALMMKHWTCQSHQYQCQTGQCINFAWVCDGEWDCADASDEEAIVLIQKWSIHNSRFEDLNERVEKCRTRYFQSTFSEICNTSFEFGCYQAKVANPLDIRLYRPCINLTQIGDGVENCYNAYDEKNTFAVNSEQMTMLGFHFTCKNNTFPYTDGCDSVKENNCTEILCPNHRNDLGRCSGIKDVRCLESDQCERNARCNGERDCIHGEDEYWCASGTIHDQVFYRSRKRMSSIRDIEQVVFDSKFPLAPITLSDNEQAGVTPINHTENPFRIMHSYQCNRGVSILQMNETICLCPPAYYGRWCEFFSDRISIIVKEEQHY
ncbi:unnamed protein product [Adineta steineri]|uniref:Uncharacterized protein n=1 Tax=Adineta steineri TaxID=433720 RepID=A0A813PRI4_9BILA|nr:unnamed protein product [Adineta steineri]CAF0794456.1 unnamed protein product [Adineta steineri]